MTPNLLVIGSLNMDITARVGRLPRPGETVFGSDTYQAPGGKGGNQAVAAARLGALVQMVARTGRDAFGEALVRALAAEGVGVRHVREADAPTGLALILVSDGGQNMIAVVPGANAALASADLDGLPVPSGTWALGVLEVPDDPLIAGFGLCRDAGGRTVLNAAPARPFADALWGLTDVLVVNETEAEALTGEPAADVRAAALAARRLAARGPSMVAVTLGAQGSVLRTPEGTWHQPALAVEAVDATAAGDAWCGALATALAAGRPWREAVAFASAAGALAATRPGAQPSLPRRGEVEALMQQVPAPIPLS